MRKVDNASQSAGISTGASFNNYQFDFGLGSGSKSSSNAPLKDQKPPAGSFSQPWTTPLASKTGPSQSTAASGWSHFQSASSGWETQVGARGSRSSSGGGSAAPQQQTWADYKPMTQPVGGSKPMASGGMKPVNTTANSGYKSGSAGKFTTAGLGLTETRSADVFGDLVGAAFTSSSTPMNKIPPKTSPFSFGKLDASLPKDASEVPGRLGTPPLPTTSKSAEPRSNARKSATAPSSGSLFPDISAGDHSSCSDDVFGFGISSSTTASSVPSSIPARDPFDFGGSSSSATGKDPFAMRGGNSNPQRPSPSMPDPFDIFAAKQNPSSSRKMADPMDVLFSKSAPPSKATPSVPAAADDDWGVFGGASSSGSTGGNEPSTTELEGLPPPPAGVTAESACNKGTDFYRNGQFPDAVKWLTWSVELAGGDKELSVKVLTSRGSCHKEIGEMKKAVADYSQAIKLKPKDTVLILQRASLYESMEKYKLALIDLKLVNQLDPSNKGALGTLMRLQKMVDHYTPTDTRGYSCV